MAFFFNEVEATKSKTKIIPIHTAKTLECAVCPLKKTDAQHPNIPPLGSDTPIFYFLNTAPRELEDQEGVAIAGRTKDLIIDAMPKNSAMRFNNVVRTYVPEGRTPSDVELACCMKSIVTDIKKTKPKVIIALGATALNWLMPDANEYQDINKWRGCFFPVNVEGYVCWGYCLSSPEFIFNNRRTNKNGEEYKSDHDYVFELDVKRLTRFPAVKPSWYQLSDLTQGIQFTEGLKSDSELQKILQWLEWATQQPKVAIDYETFSLRPYVEGTQIATVSIGTFKKCFAFPYAWPNAWHPHQLETLKKAMSKFLTSQVVKIAHNAKFELEWSAFMFTPKTLQSNWEDTQGMAYTLDERRGTHSLNFLSKKHFGFWLKQKSSVDVTDLKTQVLEEVLRYNAMDTKWTYNLHDMLQTQLREEPKLFKVYQNSLEIIKMLAQIQLRGVVYNPVVLNQLLESHLDEIDKIEQQIKLIPELKLYADAFNQSFHIGSPNHVLNMFTHILDLSEQMQNKNGKMSTDEATLKQIDHPLARHILEWRGHNKVISTYLEPMSEYVMPTGLIHTNYNPYNTTTGRLCIAKGTLIATIDAIGNPALKPIEEIQIGDMVYSYDENLKLILKPVLNTERMGWKPAVVTTWRNLITNNLTSLVSTDDHRIRLAQLGYHYLEAQQFTEAQPNLVMSINMLHFTKFCVKSTLISSDMSQFVNLLSLEDYVEVYDLTIQDTNNFIANGICVHNSSDTPNLQNFPSKTGKEPRGMIKAPPGYTLVCGDYGQIEARLIGYASQDKNFCKALWDNYDVHLEWAKNIAEAYPPIIGGVDQLENPKALKTLRSKVKNLWVFPAFYGASINSISAGLGLPLSIGKELFNIFWEQFKGVKTWQNWLVHEFQQNGYVESFFGRRRHAPLTRNMVINSPIQGSASDVCVLSMVELNAAGLEVVLNVHDEIGIYVPNNQLDTQIETMVKIMTKPRLQYLNIPISVEIKVGQDWFNMEDVLTIDSTEFYSVPNRLFDFRTIYD